MSRGFLFKRHPLPSGQYCRRIGLDSGEQGYLKFYASHGKYVWLVLCLIRIEDNALYCTKHVRR